MRSSRSIALLAVFLSAASCAEAGTPGDSSLATGPVANDRGVSSEVCRGLIGAVSVEMVDVPRDATCVLEGTRVRGNVFVRAGAHLQARNVRVAGNVQAEDAGGVYVVDSFIDGNIQVKRRASTHVEGTAIDGDLQVEESDAWTFAFANRIGGNLQVKKSAGGGLNRNRVDGDVQLEENRAFLEASENSVAGNLQVVKNAGGVRLEGNRVRQAMQCKENRPAPVGGGNTAGEKEEQCRRL